MRHASPALPTTHPHAGAKGHPSLGWIAAALTVMVGGFVANSMLSTPQASVDRAAPPALVAPVPAAVSADSYGGQSVDSQEVTAAVRNWTWETPSSNHAPSKAQDLEELWLPR
jgi:hypothetical protein